MKKVLEELRNKVFWIVDTIKGGKLRREYEDIGFILQQYETSRSIERRKDLLMKIMAHATETTAFYADYSGATSLMDFPVIDKVKIRGNFNDFQSMAYKNSSKFTVSTSGSSGTPFISFQNKGKVLRNRADTIFFQERAGYKIGYRLYYVRKWLPKYKRGRIKSWLRNIKMVNVADFSDAYLDTFITTLKKDTSTKVILAYSSALRDICRYLDKIDSKPIETNISSIIAMAEGLTEETRAKLVYYFKAPVHLRYSNQENGILSLQLSPENPNLQINWASYFIEILHPEKDVPVADGELGRIVVTDLHNYHVPMIRYDTGDFGIATREGAYFKGTKVFSKVEGRKMDILRDTKGKVTSGYNIHILESYAEIEQFQVVQVDRAIYTINLAVTKHLDNEGEIIDRFKLFLGEDAEINIKYVETIPKLSSGKRRLIINKHLNNKNKPDLV
ncbi:phenylacetate--CoA ligase family protein [Pareuzebyella sediminis]|uniref:phenylacetate--CoA ligase family protein n=1 Tax=Pareuzebyella sediminis TaxID=2607998 RepID=UPI0011EBA0A6|nr:phenylacetate--CoA ligase family protein [Pareuzebyella sediminis]